MKKNDFANAMNILLTAYGKEMNAMQMATWYGFFENDDFEDFKKAIKNLIVTSPYMPSIAQLKNEISKNYVSKEKAEDKWNNVLELVHKYGFYQSEKAMKKLDELTKVTIRQMGGFQKICSSEEGIWQKKEFLELYNQNLEEEKNKIKRGDDTCKLGATGVIKKLTS